MNYIWLIMTLLNRIMVNYVSLIFRSGIKNQKVVGLIDEALNKSCFFMLQINTIRWLIDQDRVRDQTKTSITSF